MTPVPITDLPMVVRGYYPDRDYHGWRKTMVDGMVEGFMTQRKMVLWSGAADSGKTRTMADALMALWWLQPETTTIFLASPTRDATDTGLWAAMRESFDDARRVLPNLPGQLGPSRMSIVFDVKKHPRGFIRVVAIDDVGKLQGRKLREVGVGRLVVATDELAKFTTNAVPDVMKNLVTVEGFLLLAASNFENASDSFGFLAEPAGGYGVLDPETSHKWLTKRFNGICYRFDGHKSPNFDAGKDIYEYLPKIGHAKMVAEAFGINSPEYWSQIRAFPVLDRDEFTVLNTAKIEAGDAKRDVIEWTVDPIELLLFVDAGFGGDACVAQEARLGYEKFGDGKVQVLELMAPKIVPIDLTLHEDGRRVIADEQIVRWVKQRALEAHIPFRNIAFDDSLRGEGITAAFLRGLSVEVQPIHFGGPPTDRRLSSLGNVSAKNVYDRLASELWFAVAVLVASRQMRGLGRNSAAIAQLCARRWKLSGKKRVLDTKEEYKRLNRGQSPNEADAVVGCVEMARRLGLQFDAAVSNGGPLKLVLDLIHEREISRTRAILTRRSELPSGTLHGIKPLETANAGRLNRR